MASKEEFKEGDKIRVTKNCSGSIAGKTYTLAYRNEVLTATDPKGQSSCTCSDGWELISNNYNTMNLKEKFTLAFKGEPEKSFIKAGVMNPDESLTEDGQALVLAFVLKKYGADFKKEVVDPILEEEAKKD